MMTYEQTIAFGAGQYADVLEMLNREGLPATFTQTGGMCAAIEVQLETGQTLLITDADDTLSWYRAEQAGWGVGRYTADADHEVIAYEQNDASEDLDTLKTLIRAVLIPSATSPKGQL